MSPKSFCLPPCLQSPKTRFKLVCFLLQALGVSSSSDRAALKKRIKDLKAAIDKERKQQEKEQRARDKLEKQSSTKKKKFPFVK